MTLGLIENCDLASASLAKVFVNIVIENCDPVTNGDAKEEEKMAKKWFVILLYIRSPLIGNSASQMSPQINNITSLGLSDEEICPKLVVLA